LTLPGLQGDLDVEFIVDTGFAGDLALPAPFVYRLDGTLKGTRPRMMADGRLASFPVYKATVDRDGEPRDVEVLVMDREPLVGTNLLRDYLLQVELAENGEVTAEPM
jgi:clan AA aspartic protease